jgi:hypothetical protein
MYEMGEMEAERYEEGQKREAERGGSGWAVERQTKGSTDGPID